MELPGHDFNQTSLSWAETADVALIFFFFLTEVTSVLAFSDQGRFANPHFYTPNQSLFKQISTQFQIQISRGKSLLESWGTTFPTD